MKKLLKHPLCTLVFKGNTLNITTPGIYGLGGVYENMPDDVKNVYGSLVVFGSPSGGRSQLLIISSGTYSRFFSSAEQQRFESWKN